MSTTVDNRIVEMQFDNREFEANAKASINTLEKLKDELDMSKAARGFNELDGAAKQVDFNPLMSAVQSVGEKFSAMDVVAITAISRITNAAIDAGKKLVSSLSIDQIASGWSKYAEITTSTATIMAATAKDIGEGDEYLYHSKEEQMAAVSGWLDKLALFADETSYSLTDMTSNIAKFTSMNIPLEKSVKAMEGIATWAALSGSNTAQASRAMYNLSQALGMGSVRVQDWMSIENAGMATYEFKNIVIDLATKMGKLDKEGRTFGKNTEKTAKIINEVTGELEIVKQTTEATKVTAENFRSTLAEGWFDNEVLTAVLEKYGAFSTKLMDYVDESDLTANDWLDAIEKFNSGSEEFDIDAFAKGVKVFNEETGKMETPTIEKMAEVLKDLGSETYELGRKAFAAAQEAKTFEEAINATKDAVSSKWMKIFQLIFGDYEQAKKLWTTLSNELYDIFAEPLNGVIELFREWHDAEEGGYKDFWGAVLDLWKSLKEVIGAVKEGFKEIFPPKTADTLIEATKNFKAFAERMKPSKKLLEQIKLGATSVAKAVKGISLAFKMLGKIIGSVFAGIRKVFFRSNPLEEFTDDAEKMADVVNGPVFSLLDKFGNTMQDLYDKLDSGTLLTDITNGVVTFAEKVKSAFAMVKEALDALGVTDFLKKAKNNIVGFFKSFKKGTGIAEVGEEAEAAVNPLIKFGNRVKDVFGKIGGFLKGNFSIEKIKEFFTGIGDFFKTQGQNIAAGAQMFGDNIKKAGEAISNGFAPIGKFIGKSFTKLGEFLNKFIDGLTLDKIIEYVKSGVLIKFLIDLSKFFAGIANFSLGLGKIALSLPRSIRKIANGVESFGDGFYKLGKAANKMGWAAMIKSLALALISFAASCAIVALIPADKIDQVMKLMITAFAGLAGVMLAAGLASKMGGGSNLSSLLGVAAIAIAMGAIVLKLVASMQKIADLNTDQFAQGLYGIAAVVGLTAMLVAMPMLLARQNSVAKKFLSGDMTKTLNKASSGGDVNYKGLALALLIMGGTINKIASVVERLGNIDPIQFAQGVTGITIIMGMLGLLMFVIGKMDNAAKKGDKKAGSTAKSVSKVAKTLLSLSIGLSILALAVKHIADVPLPNMAAAVGAIAILGFAMAGMEILIANFGSGKSVAGIGIGLLLMASALSLMVIPIKALANLEIDTGELWTAVLGLSALVGVITVMSAVLSKLATGGLGVMGVGAGLILIAAALNLMVVPIATLAHLENNTAEMWNAVGAISALLGVIGVMAGLLSTFAVGGLGVMGVGAGLILIAAALNLMIAPVVALANLNNDTAELWNAVWALVALAGIISAIAGVISAFTLGGLGVIGVGAGLILISMALTEMAEPLKTLAGIDPGPLWNAFGALAAMLLVLAAFAGLTAGGATLVVTGVGLAIVANALCLVADAMIGLEAIDPVHTWSMVGALAVASVLSAPILLLSVALSALGGSLVILGSGATLAGEGMLVLVDGLQALVDFIVNIAESIGNLIQNVWNSIITSFKNFFGIHSPSTVMEEEGGFLISGLVKGLENFDAIQAIKGAVQFIGGKIKDFFGGIGDTFKKVGEGISGLVGKGIQGAKNIVTNVVEFGKNIGQDLSNGIDNKASVVTNAVSKVANGAVGLFKKIFKIHSPSKLMEEMGGYLDEGLAQGIEKNAGTTDNAMASLGSSAIDKLSSVFNLENFDMSAIKDWVSGNLSLDNIDITSLLSNFTGLGDNLGSSLGDGLMDNLTNSLTGQLGGLMDGFSTDDLTLTPVMDLSQIEAGFGDIDSLASSYDLSLGASGDFSSLSNGLQNGTAGDNADIISAINTIREEVASLSQLVGKMQVVMDTGALVGQLTVPMDEALGKQLVYGNRGM